MVRHNLLKLPYQIDVRTDYVCALAFRFRRNKVEVPKFMKDVYCSASKAGVLVYRAKDVDVAFLLVWPYEGGRRVYEVYVSRRVKPDVHATLSKLVELLWTVHGKGCVDIMMMLSGRSVEEVKKMSHEYTQYASVSNLLTH